MELSISLTVDFLLQRIKLCKRTSAEVKWGLHKMNGGKKGISSQEKLCHNCIQALNKNRLLSSSSFLFPLVWTVLRKYPSFKF